MRFVMCVCDAVGRWGFCLLVVGGCFRLLYFKTFVIYVLRIFTFKSKMFVLFLRKNDHRSFYGDSLSLQLSDLLVFFSLISLDQNSIHVFRIEPQTIFYPHLFCFEYMKHW